MDRWNVYITNEFVKNAFIKNHHYSFNHRSVMYNHSVTVMELSLKISEHVECEKNILAIWALLHDIWKTYRAAPEILHKDHEDFNLKMSESFLKSLKLSDEEYEKVCKLITYQSDSIEMKIIKDADALAMYYDKKLYMLWIERACENNLNSDIARKLGKFDKLNFNISKELWKPKLEQMRKDWDEYLKKFGS